MNRKSWIRLTGIVVVLAVGILIGVTTCRSCRHVEKTPEVAPKLLYGIPEDDHDIIGGIIESGQTLSDILSQFGISPARIDALSKKSQPIFDLRDIRSGNKYTAFLTLDSTQHLSHLVYEHNPKDYVVFSFEGDSIEVRMEQKEVRVVRRQSTAEVTSSLWNAMTEKNLNPVLAIDLAEIFAWSIDFFALQPQDSLEVIYDEQYIDSTSIGVGRILGAWFVHGGKKYFAIPFEQDGRVSYWDEKGNSLRKNILKAPLKFSRISSRFSNSRMHPVLRIRRPHHGVDYSAAAGTPVHAVADGTVTMRCYSGGGGNTIKIKHAQGLSSGYLHLRGFAKGIAVGRRVSQGALIGYVGSTGLSTGPHLDFRIWRNGKAIDPLKIPSTPAEPIKKANLMEFNKVRNRVLSALAGKIPADSIDKEAPRIDSVKIAHPHGSSK